MKKIFKLLTVLSFVSVLIFGITAGAFAEDLTIAIPVEPDTLDPHQTIMIYSLTILSYVIEPLFTLDENYDVVPLLASSYDLSEDGKLMTVKLKKGIKFHNGTEMTSEDVKASYKRYFEKSPLAHYLVPEQGGIYKIDTPDRYTVVFHFKEAKPLALYYMADAHVSIMPKEWLENAGDDVIGLSALIGTGPYMFKEWNSGSEIIMERFEDYHHAPEFIENKGPAKMERVVFRIIPEESTLVAELTTGNVDVSFDVPIRFVSRVKNNPNLNVKTKPAYMVWFMAMNMDKEVIQDKKVRVAIAHAINKDDIVKAAWFGAAPKAYGLINKAIIGYWPGVKDIAYKFNPERARELLNEAGWKDVDNDGIREKDGKELSLTLASQNRATIRKTAEVIQQGLKEVGIDVNIQTAETGAHYERLKAGKYDLCMVGNCWWMGQPYLYFLTHSDNIGSSNFGRYANPELDRNLEIAGNSMDTEERKEALMKVQRIVVESAVWVPLVSGVDALAAKKDVKGIEDLIVHPWWPPLMRALLLYK